MKLSSLSLATKLLIGWCLVHLVVNVIWLLLNQHPLAWDQAGHARLAIEFAQYFIGSYTKPIYPIEISSYYPPLTYIFTSLFLIIFGWHSFWLSLPITLLFVILLIGIYILVRELTKNEWTALLTSIFFSLFPPIFENSRWLLLEIPLLTTLVYTWWFLWKSEGFSKLSYSLLLGIGVAAVLLTKWIGVVFLVIPGLFVLVQRMKLGLKQHHLINLGLICGIVLILSLPWYFANQARLLEISRIAAQGEVTDPQSKFSIENLRFYFTHILNFQLTLWPSLIALLASVWFFATNHKHKLLLGTYFLTGYILFTFISNKDIRYTLPLLLVPALVLATSMAENWRNKRFLAIPAVFALVFLSLHYFVLSFHLLPSYQRAWNLGPLGWIDYINTGDIVVTYPKNDPTPNKELLSYLVEKQKNTPASVMVGVDTKETNPSNLDLLITMNQYRSISLEAPYDKVTFENEQELTTYLERFKYAIIPTQNVGPDASRHKQALIQIQNHFFSNQATAYKEVARFTYKHTDQVLVVYAK